MANGTQGFGPEGEFGRESVLAVLTSILRRSLTVRSIMQSDNRTTRDHSMRNKLRVFFLTAALLISMAGGSAFAHHGTASFDRTKVTILKGIVTNFIWANPHGGIEFDVTDAKGKVQKWQGSLTSPNWLARAGWTRKTLKPGDQITISGNQSKVRANTLWITRIQLANGQELPVGGVENVE
jgi:hypothetical protein